MSIFDQAYDEMTLSEVCSRLPGDLAVKALKRRLNDLPSLLDFVNTAGSQPSYVSEVKKHFNGVFNKYSVKDILDTFSVEIHPSLFAWLDDGNRTRIKNEGREQLSTKFLFNLAGDKDLDDLKVVLNNILKEPEVKQSGVVSVLNKASPEVFSQLLDVILKDPRPEVKECVLAVSPSGNNALISDLQRVVALKAFVKSAHRIHGLATQDFKLFTALKPKERLDALTKYFSYFPSHRKVRVFNPEPSEEEFNLILFAGCIEHNDRVVELNNKYKELTVAEPPMKEEEQD